MNWKRLLRHVLGAIAGGGAVAAAPDVASDPGVSTSIAIAAYALVEKLLKHVTGEA